MTEPCDFCLGASCASRYPVSSLVIFSDLERFCKPLSLGKFKWGFFFHFKVVYNWEIIFGVCHNDKICGECRREVLPEWSYEKGMCLDHC